MKKLFTLFILLCLWTINSWAQVSGYSFSSTSGSYSALSSETVLWSGTFDESVSSAITIPSFTFNGVAYTTMYVTTNGFVTLGTTAPTTYYYSPISGAGGYSAALSPFGGDLQQAGSGSPKISYNTNDGGEVVVQFQDVRKYSSSYSTHILSCQVRMDPATGNVKFVYGGTIGATSGSTTFQVGLRGTSSSDFNNRTTTTDWAASTAGGSNTATMTFGPGVVPASGLTYTWAPPTSPVFNITPTSKDFGSQLTGTNSAYQQFIISNAGAGTLTITSGNISIVGTDASQFALVDSNSYPIGLTTGQTAKVYVRFSPTSTGSKSANLQIVDNTKATQTVPLLGIAFDPATAPWTEGFESVTIPAFPTGWFKENGDWVTTNNANSTYDADARTGTQFLRETWSATNEYIWTLPFQLTGSTSYDFTFWWAGDNYAGWTGDVFYNTSPISTGATQLGTSFVTSGVTTTKTYAKVISTFTPPATGVYYFAIRVNATSVPYYLSFDDFELDLTPACSAPTSLTATNITTNSADLGWTETGSATKWDIELGPFGFTPTGTPTANDVTSNPYTYGGLSPATQYSFYVRADCGVKEDTSPWAGPYSFTTACNAVSSLSESFEGATFPPICWTNSLWVSSLYGGPHTGTKWAYSNTTGSLLTTPEISLTVNSRLKYWYRAESASYPQDMNVLLSTDGGSTFPVTLSSHVGITNTIYAEVIVDLSAYTGQNIYIRFNGLYGTGGYDYGICVDDVVVEEIPEFVDAEVTAIISPSTTETLGSTVTPQVTVKNNSDSTKNVPVTVEIWTAESLLKSANSVENMPIPLTGKNSRIDAKSLKDVDIIQHTAIESALPTEATLLTEGFEGGVVPPSGWSQSITNASYTWKIQTTSYHSGTKSADVEYDPALSPQDESLISPVIDLSSYTGEAIKLSFWWSTSYYWHVNPYNNVDVSVDVSTDGGSSWTKLWSEDSAGVFTNWTWYNKIIDLTAYAGESNFKVRFRYLGVDGAQFLLDDIALYTEFLPVMVYQQNTTVTGLGSGSSSSPTFPNWTATPSGYYQVKAYTTLSGDAVPANDLMTKNFAVPAVLNLTALIEGFYDGSSMVSDTVMVELHNASSPYDKKDEAKVVLSTSGTTSANFYGGENTSTNYYLAIKHRNSIETWSSSTPAFSGGTMSYNFTTAQSQAYNNNLKLKFGKWCIIGGEVANNDQYIDGDDVTAAYNAQGVSGYVIQDVTGDDYVDGDDVTLAYNNQGAGVTNPIVGFTAKGIKKQVEIKKETNQE